MAHELDIQDGKAAMAYVSQKPWHGLGQQLTEDSDIDTWKVEAGMNWNAIGSPVTYQVGAETKSYKERKVIYREDNGNPLSVVSDEYKIVQPHEVLEFFRDVAKGAGFKMETAGCLFEGRKFWALAKTGDNATIMGQDEVKPYLLIASSLDGSLATCAHFTSVRVVCNNTLRMAIGNGSKAQIRVPHQAAFNADLVKAQLGIAKEAWDNFIANANKLASTKLGRDDAIDVVASSLKKEWLNLDGSYMDESAMLESSLVLRRIIELYDGKGLGASFKSSNGTAWGLVNAVTEYFDHNAAKNSKDKSRAFERAQLTDRASFKVAVADKLLEMAA